MDQIKKILAPTDLSDLSQVGVRYALNLAKAIGAEVTIGNVAERTLSRTNDLAIHLFNRAAVFSRRIIGEDSYLN